MNDPTLANFSPPSPAANRTTEMTIAEARRALAALPDLSKKELDNLLSALSGVAMVARRYPEICGNQLPDALPLTCALLNRLLYAGPPRAAGFEPKRFTDLVSLLRNAMRRLGLHEPALRAGDGLTQAWRTLHDQLENRYHRMRLIGFMRFCTVSGIAPDAVDQDTLAAYATWCRTRTINENIDRIVRNTAANWQWALGTIEGWPRCELSAPQVRQRYTLPLEAYPASFQQDVAAYVDRLSGQDTTFLDPLSNPVFTVAGTPSRSPRHGFRTLAARTIKTRLDHIRCAAAALVSGGMDPSELRSLRDLVTPIERPRAILRFHRDRLLRSRAERGEPCDLRSAKSAHLEGIAEALRQIGTYHCQLDAGTVKALADLKSHVGRDQQLTMTPKNRGRLLRLIELRTRALLLHLPAHWMRLAADPALPPAEAARYALYATALEVLLVCPLRRENMGKLDIVRSFRRGDNGRGSIQRLLVAGTVKNGVDVDWPLPVASARLIETYLKRHRPHLVDDPANTFLFPGKGRLPRNTHELGITLCKRVTAEIGAEVNTHIFRHFAAWLFLKNNPGQYEIVRQALGHKKVDTTIRFYLGLEADAAARHFDSNVLKERAETQAVAQTVFRSRRGRRTITSAGTRS